MRLHDVKHGTSFMTRQRRHGHGRALGVLTAIVAALAHCHHLGQPLLLNPLPKRCRSCPALVDELPRISPQVKHLCLVGAPEGKLEVGFACRLVDGADSQPGVVVDEKL